MSTSTTQKPTTRRIVGMVVGIVIIGLGIALFKQSHLGNDSISALNMRLAELLGISLGVQNVATNILFFALEFWFGRKYIGLGDRKSTRLNSSHASKSRMPSSA